MSRPTHFACLHDEYKRFVSYHRGPCHPCIQHSKMFHASWPQPCTTESICWIFVSLHPVYLMFSESVQCSAGFLGGFAKNNCGDAYTHSGDRSDAFDNIFAPPISDLSQHTNLVTKTCTTAYNAEDHPKDQLWCMVLGRYLEKHLIKASRIYKRRWPVSYAVSPRFLLEVEMLCLYSICFL